MIAALIAKFPNSYGREVPGEADADEWSNLESTDHRRTHLKKGLAALLAAVFMTGLAGVALANEKKAEDKAQTEKAADSHAKMRARSAAGTVKAAAADSLVVAAKKGDLTFSVDDKTMIKKGGKAITASDIKPGDSVHVRYMEHDGKMSVTVKGGGTASKNPCASKK